MPAGVIVRGWTQEQMDLLKHLWCVRGMSAKEIAPLLGDPPRSRSAVLGTVFRNGWEQGRLPEPEAPPEPVVVAPPPEPVPVAAAAPARPFLARYPEPAVCATPGCRGPRQTGRDLCADCHTHQRVSLKPVVNRAPALYPHHKTGRPRLARSK